MSSFPERSQPEAATDSPASQPRSETAYLSNDWKHWLATNLLLGRPEGELAQALISAGGFSPAVAEAEILVAKTHPYLQAGLSIGRQLRKRDWVLHCLRTLEAQSGRFGQIDRRHRLSGPDFFEAYYSRNRPVVITGMLEHWPALTRWTPEYLKAHFGHLAVQVQAGRTSDPEYEINSHHHRREVPFAEYIDRIHTGGITNDYYMTANNGSHNQRVLHALWQDTPLLGDYLKPDAENPGFFWYGPQGIVTPLHHDLTNNFMAQVMGRKRILLISPAHLALVYNHRHVFSAVDLTAIDYARFPAFRDVQPIEIILQPGEILFLPVGWWHHVTGLDVVITMTYTNFIQPNYFSDAYSTYDFI